MSSVPPTPPPGGGAPPPYPPYDPKTQWKVYRAQQRAAWKAQRDAWKAQHYAWKANYVGVYGPRVPSVVGPILLIGIGVIALLVAAGRLGAGDFWAWYGKWWPLLLIGIAGPGTAGRVRSTSGARLPSGEAAALWASILLAILGFGATGWKKRAIRRTKHGNRNKYVLLDHRPRHVRTRMEVVRSRRTRPRGVALQWSMLGWCSPAAPLPR